MTPKAQLKYRNEGYIHTDIYMHAYIHTYMHARTHIHTYIQINPSLNRTQPGQVFKIPFRGVLGLMRFLSSSFFHFTIEFYL